MYGSSLTRRLAGFLAVLVAGAIVLRWAIDQLMPYFWLFVVATVLVGLWRVSSLIRRRW